LDLGDSYKEAQRLGAGCGIGPGFDPGNISDVNNTLMQQHRLSDTWCQYNGKTASEYDPFLTDTPCYGIDSSGALLNDCKSYKLTTSPSDSSIYPFTCEYVPTLNSELSVAANFDLLQNSGAASCPAPQPGKILVLRARLWPGQPANQPPIGQPGRDCGNAQIDAGEMCDGSQLGGQTCATLGFVGGALTCNPNCSLNTLACSPSAQCGDGTRQSTEECEPGEDLVLNPLRSCQDVGMLSVNSNPPGCQANCGADWNTCGGNPSPDMDLNGLTWEEAKELTDLNKAFAVIDALGNVGDVFEPGPSRHLLGVFFERIASQLWRVHFAMPENEFAGGSLETLRVVDTFDLVFDGAGQVVSVDGVPGARGSLELGGSTTGAFLSGAPASVLEVRFDDLEMITWTNKSNVTARRSEWDQARGAYPGTGVYGAVPDPANPGQLLPVDQLGQCNDTQHCQWAWNAPTFTYEATAHYIQRHGEIPPGSPPGTLPPKVSEWQRAQASLAAKGFNLIMPPGDLPPNSAPPVNCTTPVTFDTAGVGVPDTVLMVLDRSGSMNLTSDVIGGQGRSRLDYMRDSAKNFARLQQAGNAKTGLITFNSVVTTEMEPIDVYRPVGANRCGGSTPDICANECFNFSTDVQNCGTCGNVCTVGQVCFQGACAAACGSSSSGAALNSCDGSCVDLQSDPNHCGACGATCAPRTPACELGVCKEVGGATAAPLEPTTTVEHYYSKIDALVAQDQTAIGPALREAQAQLAQYPGHRAVMLMSDGIANVGEEPLPVMDELVQSGIDVYFVPATNEAKAALAGRMKEASDGGAGAEVFDGQSGEALPAAFFESYVRSRSEALVLDRTHIAVELGEGVLRQVTEIDPSEIPDLGETSGGPTHPEQQALLIPVEADAGRLNVLVSSETVTNVSWDSLMKLKDPAGNVVLTESSPGVAVGSLIKMFQVEHPAAGTWTLEIKANSRSVQRSLVEAHVESPHPDCRVQLSAYHVGPGTRVDVRAQAYWDNRLIVRGAQFHARALQPDGGMKSFDLTPSLEPSVGAQGSFQAGGNLGLHRVSVACSVDENAILTEGESMGEPWEEDLTIDRSERFLRVGVQELYVSTAPPGAPGSGTGSGGGTCAQQPESVACCSSLSACPGAKDVGVLGGLPLGPGGPAAGWGGVILDDRAKISGLNGAPTQVISFSTTRSELGADARITGNMSNRADVFARERSKIVGNLRTGGTLIRQNPTQNIVTGTLSQNANLTSPAGTLQVPQFSATTRGDVSLEPNTTRNIRPGAYRHLSVKSRSTLTLEPGTYWFESFNVEPQAKVTTSGAQPTRIYVKGALLLKESVEHAGGRIDPSGHSVCPRRAVAPRRAFGACQLPLDMGARWSARLHRPHLGGRGRVDEASTHTGRG